MKILVATSNGQGHRENDVFDALEGELVFFGSEAGCLLDAECPCRRSMVGFGGKGSTTTMKIDDVSISRADYVLRHKLSYLARMPDDEIDDLLMPWIDDEAEEGADRLLKVASSLPVGTVIEKRLDDFYPRILEDTKQTRVLELIRKGESTAIEFKETLSLDVRKQSKESYIEVSSLKTIIGFLNSGGGSLLIGIADNGEIKGLAREIEKFHSNRDKFLLHFKNLIKSKIGEEFYPYIDYDLIDIDEEFILVIECTRSDTPCFLDGKDFYVRTNPATDRLEGPKMLSYIRHHFSPK